MDAIIIRDKVKKVTQGMSLSKDYCDELDKKVLELIENSKLRAKANQRNTVMARDL